MSAAHAEDDIPPELAFVAALQKAVGTDGGLACGHLHFPVHYYGAKTQLLRSKAEFFRRYDMVMGPELKAAILA